MWVYLLKAVLLPVLVSAFFVAYTHSIPFAHSMLPALSEVGRGGFIVAVILDGVVLALFWGLVFAAPLAWLYRRFALFVAAVCALPVLFIVGEHFATAGSLLRQIPVAAMFVPLLIIVPATAHVMHLMFARRTARATSCHP